jgi:hypothetical protein
MHALSKAAVSCAVLCCAVLLMWHDAVQAEVSDVRRELVLLDSLLRLQLNPEQQVCVARDKLC